MEEPIWPRAADLLEWVIFPSDRPQSAITEFECNGNKRGKRDDVAGTIYTQIACMSAMTMDDERPSLVWHRLFANNVT